MKTLVLILLAITAPVVAGDVTVRVVNDYTFGGYTGDFPSPPHADLNPKRAVIVQWSDRAYRLVFSHEASYCPWWEFPSGAAVCFQFFEGNDGWAELFNNFGRQERNSFVDIVEQTPQRVWIRWTYFGVNIESGKPAYRGSEDFYAFANGLVLRRQSFTSLMPGDHRGYAREPIEAICLCPVGKMWSDVLREGDKPNERHALSVLDAFSDKQYDLFWTPKKGAHVWDSTPRRSGDAWKELDDAKGVALVVPLRDAYVFTAFGDASGFGHEFTKLKEHTHHDTGGLDWGSTSWDHWPIGRLNSQAHEVDADSLKKYPNHFSPMGMDFFALPDAQVADRNFWSLYGASENRQQIRGVVRRWLERDCTSQNAAELRPIDAQTR